MDSILDMGDIIDDLEAPINTDTPFQDGVLGGKMTQSGIQSQDLQAVIDSYPDALNKFAIAKSTGMPVRTPVQQYKGFAAEEAHKWSLKINALAKGVPNYKVGVYTNGPTPDGATLSAIDMHSDLQVFSRKWPWQEPVKIADAQLKIHKGPNAQKAYAKDMAKEQYAGKEFVGGSGQGINDKVHAKFGKIEVTSDGNTPEAYEKLAADMKNQSAPKYDLAKEKQNQLNQIHIKQAVAAGAITGAVLSTVGELCYVIKNKDSLDEDQFIKSVQNILCGTVDGGVRGGAIASSVQVIGKALGKEIPTNSLGAVPIMAAANMSVDFGKDLYKCFISKEIDMDDLLCNSVNNSFSSLAGFGGAWAGGQLAGHVLAQSPGMIAAAKTAAATGASIGSALGPIGTVIGSAVGGLLIGLGANAVIKTGTNDAQKAFDTCINSINEQIELEGYEKLYYFADSMSEISEFKISFKDLLPCYNLISDLKEYNLHKKAIKHIHEQIDICINEMDHRKEKILVQMEENHKDRLQKLEIWISEQNEMYFSDFRDSINTYITNSYMQYVEIAEFGKTERLFRFRGMPFRFSGTLSRC